MLVWQVNHLEFGGAGNPAVIAATGGALGASDKGASPGTDALGFTAGGDLVSSSLFRFKLATNAFALAM